MKWKYEITWMDGLVLSYVSTRFIHQERGDLNLTIYVNEHGHDRRYDTITIPLENVRTVAIEEVR